MSEWQPIKDAPKTGVRILGVNSNLDQAVIYWDGFNWVPSFVLLDRERVVTYWNDKSMVFWSGYALAWKPLEPFTLQDLKQMQESK